MSEKIIIATAAIYGVLAIILGAFGAHLLKNVLTTDQQKSFETGVKYQMYHAIVLLLLGFNPEYASLTTYCLFTIGILFFSFSIYGLVLSDAKGRKMRFLGPITPIGGVLLILAWTTVLYTAIA